MGSRKGCDEGGLGTGQRAITPVGPSLSDGAAIDPAWSLGELIAEWVPRFIVAPLVPGGKPLIKESSHDVSKNPKYFVDRHI